ncbi:MAG: twin-arginine translocase TatA/TatE family subunit [Pseudomonadota bacterium]
MDTLMILGFLGSLGTTELLMVFVVVLILFGPKQLPQIAKTIGKGLRDIRRAANQLKHEVGLDELDEIYPRSRPIPPPRREPATGDGSGAVAPDVGAEAPPTGESGAEGDPELDPEIRRSIGARVPSAPESGTGTVKGPEEPGGGSGAGEEAP